MGEKLRGVPPPLFVGEKFLGLSPADVDVDGDPARGKGEGDPVRWRCASSDTLRLAPGVGVVGVLGIVPCVGVGVLGVADVGVEGVANVGVVGVKGK